LKTGSEIVKRETPLGLYKGLGAVLTGIVPKMAIRFTSYEWYKQLMADSAGNVTGQATFLGMYPVLDSDVEHASQLQRHCLAAN
jgi:solute carrier family 25 citrate transporter 1